MFLRKIAILHYTICCMWRADLVALLDKLSKQKNILLFAQIKSSAVDLRRVSDGCTH